MLFRSYDEDLYLNTSSSVFYDIEAEEERRPSKIIIGDGHTDYKKIDIA